MSIGPLPAEVIIREVGLRDGLQSLQIVMPTERKIQWIGKAYSAGIREIEVGSMVPASRLAQLADTAALVAYAKGLSNLKTSVLVPNLRGANDALALGVDSILLPLSASHQHSIANLRRTPDEVVQIMAQMRASRDSMSSTCKLEGGVGTAFGCTLAGAVDPADVMRILQSLLDAGADYVSLADTVGYADPASVSRLFEMAKGKFGNHFRGGHFHDTRGLALANTLAAMSCGVNVFDASLGGIGGCPHAPGASGNSATEDLVFMLQAMGIRTSIDLGELLELRADLGQWISGQSTHGALHTAGLPKQFQGELV